jgi:hypothetical protein
MQPIIRNIDFMMIFPLNFGNDLYDYRKYYLLLNDRRYTRQGSSMGKTILKKPYNYDYHIKKIPAIFSKDGWDDSELNFLSV